MTPERVADSTRKIIVCPDPWKQLRDAANKAVDGLARQIRDVNKAGLFFTADQLSTIESSLYTALAALPADLPRVEATTEEVHERIHRVLSKKWEGMASVSRAVLEQIDAELDSLRADWPEGGIVRWQGHYYGCHGRDGNRVKLTQDPMMHWTGEGDYLAPVEECKLVGIPPGKGTTRFRQDAGGTSICTRCEIGQADPIDPDWNYCPWCGREIESIEEARG